MPRSSQFQNSDMYLVDSQLRAVPLTQIYQRPRWIAEREGRKQAEPVDAPLPVSPDGTLVAGVLYASSTEPQVRYYLPQYAIMQRNGMYRVQLKWNAGLADPNAAFARLTIDLQAQVPDAQGFTLREIEHQAVVRLGYHLPVATDQGAPTADSAPAFWYEISALQPSEGQVQRCQMDIFAKQDFDRLYQIMTDPSYGGTLEIRCFATIGHRTYRQVVVCDPPWIPRLPPETSFRVRAATLGEESVGEPIFQVLPQPVVAAPEENGPMTLGELNVNVMTSIALLPFQMQTPIAAVSPVAPFFATALSPVVASQIVAQPIQERVTPQRDRVVLPDAARQIDWQAVRTSPVAAADTTEMLRVSDFVVEQTAIAAIPVGALVRADGKPVLLRVDAEAQQQIRPFAFPIETNGYIFDIPAHLRPTASQKLQPYSVPANDGRMGHFYYDLGLDMFYYQPTEFRLSRLARPLDQSSYQPYLVITMLNVVTGEGANGAAATSCRVNITYQALPCIDPDLLDAAANYFKRNNIHQAPRFAPLNPVRSKLTLHLPQDTAGTQFEQVERLDAAIDFDHGLSDNLNISDAQFEPIAAALLAGMGLQGTVEIYLLSEQSAPITVGVRLALNDTAGPLFDTALQGHAEGAGDRYTVRLTNRVESPARIDRLDPVTAGASAVAFPQTAGGAVVQPGQSLLVEYKVEPADAVLRDLDPIVFGSVVLDDEALRKQLWRRLIVEEGYTSETFTVTASIDPAYFETTPDGMQPLAGVRVDFRGGGSAVLTQASPSQNVTLQQGYLAALLRDPLSYRYTVTNLHTDPAQADKTIDGAQSDLLNDEVPELRVEPANE